MRILHWIFAAGLLLAGTAPSRAEGYPTRPVRVVVGFPAGGPIDVIARLVAQKLSDSLGQQFYVENVPGAGGNTASGQLARGGGWLHHHGDQHGLHGQSEPLRQGAV